MDFDVEPRIISRAPTFEGLPAKGAERLETELRESSSSVTGRSMACVLIMRSGRVYGGHSVERGVPGRRATLNSTHAEINALSELRASSDRSEVAILALAGIGQSSPKRVFPCAQCFEQLQPHVGMAEIKIFAPELDLSAVSLPFADLRIAYEKQMPVSLNVSSAAEPALELSAKTPLSPDKAEDVVRLVVASKATRSRVYLVGEACGRGWTLELLPRRFSNSRSLDIGVVGEMSLQSAVEALNPLSVNFTSRYNRTIECVRLRAAVELPGRSLELSVGRSLPEVISDPFYLKQNFFVEVT